MKKFVFQSLWLFLLTSSCYLLLSLFTEPEIKETNDYLAAIIDKHERANSINEPRIIFMAGSSLAFGLNSEKIEKQFSIPVVNLALHGGVGLHFMLEELKSIIRKNDVVFLTVEYLLREDGDYGIKKLTSTFFPEASDYYNTNLKDEITIHLDRTRSHIEILLGHQMDKVQPSQIYFRKAFNKYGDVVSHLDKDPRIELNGRGEVPSRNWDRNNEMLNEFYNFALAKEASVFFIYPTYPLSEYNIYSEIIEKVKSKLSANLQIEIINQPEDLVFGDDMFFDTIFHLNKEGREKQTQKYIEFMQSNSNAMRSIERVRELLRNSDN